MRLAVEGTGARVRADRDRVVQVLSNLVENALRYTPAGGLITIGAAVEQGRARLSVADGGPGFDPADLERAFERQHLWSKYRGERDVGTGLGLVICRQLAQLMDGRVSAANAAGRGAVFTLELPLADSLD